MAIGNKGKIKIEYSGDEPRKLAPYKNDVIYDITNSQPIYPEKNAKFGKTIKNEKRTK